MDNAASHWPEDKEGFRLRGLEITRIEAFTDAAFAFAVTLLVISTQTVPSTYAELTNALTGIPAFIVSFALIMIFWYGHWKWSRRFGLEDMPTIVLSGGLVLAVLICVYPLKYVNSLTVYYFSGGRITTSASIESFEQLYHLFAIFGVGLVAMNLFIAALNTYAYRVRETLQLDELERCLTRVEIRVWLLAGGVAAVSVALALLTEPSPLMLPGWIYFLLAPMLPIYAVRAKRKAGRLRQARLQPDPVQMAVPAVES